MNVLEKFTQIVSLLEEVKQTDTLLSQTDQLVISRIYSDAKYLEKKMALTNNRKNDIFEKQKQTGGKNNKSMEELLSNYYDTIHDENN